MPSMFDVPVRNPAETVILKCAIAYHLRIQATVVGVIDLFGHQPVERGANRMNRLIQLDVERDW